jgi:intermembrane space import and assembly protein 40
MQNCFREYPEIYGAELESDEEEDEGAVDLAQAESGRPTDNTVVGKDRDLLPQKASDSAARDASDQKKDHSMVPEAYRPDADDNDSKAEEAQKETEQVIREHEPNSESGALVPKSSHDATGDNKEKK